MKINLAVNQQNSDPHTTPIYTKWLALKFDFSIHDPNSYKWFIKVLNSSYKQFFLFEVIQNSCDTISVFLSQLFNKLSQNLYYFPA